jgi:hypothetical protein
MKIEYGTKFTTSFSNYQPIGFHASSTKASPEIEKNGIYPSKVFGYSEHEKIISIANEIRIDAEYYKHWLEMRSVTFTREFASAMSHIRQGSAGGGQGLGNMVNVLNEIKLMGNEYQKNVAETYLSKIQLLRSSSPVIYAVDLSHLGPRLVMDQHQPLYQLYWQPDCNLPPSEQLITPAHLISKLEVTV